MFDEGHIFTIKTKDPDNVAGIKSGADNVVISGLNVLKDQIKIGDFVFVVFGGDKPKGWKPGLVGLAHISKTPFDEGYDGNKNFRVAIDVDVYFEPPIVRGDLVTYPDTFDTIGIGPITKWEPNQAITSVAKKNAIGLVQAIWDMRPNSRDKLKELLGHDMPDIPKRVRRFIESSSGLGASLGLRDEFEKWLKTVYLTPKGVHPGSSSIDTYINCLDSVNKPDKKGTPIHQHSEQLWYNIYEYLYGAKAKDVFSVDSLTELELVYGGLRRVVDYTNADIPEGVVKEHYDNVKAWINSEKVKRSGWIKSSFNRYIDFLEWRNARKNNDAPQFSASDLLSIALKLFAEKRALPVPGKEKSFDEFNAVSRAQGEVINGAYLVGCDYEAFRKTLNDRQVANSFFSKHTEDEKRRLGDFIAGVRSEPKDISCYLMNLPDVAGVGGMMLTAFLTRTRPDLYAFYSKQMFESVKFLGLANDAALPDLTPDSYNTYKGIQTTIRDRMREMGIKAENGNVADYLTVNEFTWFVSEYQDQIKEEVMSNQLKSDKPTKYDEGKRKELKFDPASKDDKLLLRLLSALRAKPFAILAGHSGTGKSRYVKKLAYMTCNMDELRNNDQLPGNCLLLQVKPNWHDSTELLGFRNAMDENKYQKTKHIEFLFRAYHFKDTPFFLCLDEMNLAPVEQYFAEFLSSMESKEPIPLNDISENEDNLVELGCEWTDARDYLAAKGFSIPGNLFIVGTVNMDETTNQFSRKVLDRAFTIEMTDVDFKSYGKVTEPSYDDTLKEETIQALLNGPKKIKELDADDIVEEAPLVKVQKALEPTAFAVAYRFANEYTLLKRAIACFDPEKKMGLDALDQAVLMKVLPRIAGERDYIEIVYGKKEDEGLRKALAGKVDSLKKIEEILKRAKDMSAQYITFWP